jgi:CHAT domain-containing protein
VKVVSGPLSGAQLLVSVCRVLPCLILTQCGPSSTSLDLRRVLDPERTLQGTIDGSRRDAYRLRLGSGDAARILLDQRDADLGVTVALAAGRPSEELDLREHGEEALTITADVAGDFELVVHAIDPHSNGMTYALRMETPRDATANDRLRVAAQRATSEGKRLAGTAGSHAQQQALERLKEGRRLWRELGDRRLEAATVAAIGDVFHRRNDFDSAESMYLDALDLSRRLGDRRDESTALNNLGVVCWKRGRLDPAFEYFQQALAGWRALPFRYGEAASTTNEALLSWEAGDYQRALNLHLRALTIFQTLHDGAGEAYALNNIGMTYRALSDDETAFDYLNRARAGFAASKDALAESRALVRLGQIRLAGGDARAASEHAERALSVIRQLGDRMAEADALMLLGEVAETSGAFTVALTDYEQARGYYRGAGNRRGEATALHRAGIVRHARNDRAALDTLGEALAIRHDLGLRDAEAATLYRIALIERGQGKLAAAVRRVQTAIGLTEDVRARVAGDYSRTSYFAARQEYYATYVDLLMQLHSREPARGFAAKAFETAERARARTFLDLLVESGADIRSGVDPALLSRARDAERRIHFWSFRLSNATAAPGGDETNRAAREQLSQALTDHRETEARIRAAGPPGAAHAEPVSVREVQRDVLDRDSVLLRFALGEERSYVWVVTKTSLDVVSLPARAVVEPVARQVYALVSARRPASAAASVGEYNAAAKALSALVLQPISTLLARRRLLIVCDGVLQFVPFSALPHPGSGRPLVLTHETVMLPSASTLAVMRRVRTQPAAPRTLALFADPVYEPDDPRVRSTGIDVRTTVARSSAGEPPLVRLSRLPFSRLEGESISILVPPGERFEAFGFDANRSAATSPRLRDFRVVHFATHAVQDDRHPELSGIVLSLVDGGGARQDGFLRLFDIYNHVRLNAALVVLSGCRTAMAKDVVGEGPVSLARALIHAGARTVLSTLYAIEDDSTAEFMRVFYEGLLGPQQLNAAAALRAAQLRTLQQTGRSHPHAWSAFVLIGEPR